MVHGKRRWVSECGRDELLLIGSMPWDPESQSRNPEKSVSSAQRNKCYGMLIVGVVLDLLRS